MKSCRDSCWQLQQAEPKPASLRPTSTLAGDPCARAPVIGAATFGRGKAAIANRSTRRCKALVHELELRPSPGNRRPRQQQPKRPGNSASASWSTVHCARPNTASTSFSMLAQTIASRAVPAAPATSSACRACRRSRSLFAMPLRARLLAQQQPQLLQPQRLVRPHVPLPFIIIFYFFIYFFFKKISSLPRPRPADHDRQTASPLTPPPPLTDVHEGGLRAFQAPRG